MSEITLPPANSFSTALPVVIHIRPSGSSGDDWQPFDRGPGRFTIPDGFEASLRIQKINDEDISVLVDDLADCAAVTELNLSENRRVTNEGLGLLKKLTQLTSLNLSSCDLNDRGLVHLQAITHLRRLNLSYCNRITDAGLKLLKPLNNLTYLDLQGCPHLTNHGIIQLRRTGLIIHYKG